MYNLVLIVFYLVTPAVILYSCKKISFLDKFGAVGIAYVLGLVLGNIGILNHDAKNIQETLTTITIPLSLPLLLFSINLKQWSRLAGKTILSMVLGIVAITTSIVLGFYLFRHGIADCWKVAGMLTGVYLGATFNMASIKIALGASDEIFGICNAYDILVCMVYFVFIISVAQRLFNKVLPPFKKSEKESKIKADVEDIYDGWDAYRGIFSRKYLPSLLIALGVALVIAAIAGGISTFFSKAYIMAVVILVITSLSILASLIPGLNQIPKTFQTGMYLILIFCVVVGSMADITMFAKTSIYVLYYVIFVIFTSLGLHFLLAWIFKVDTDTLIISSSAMIFSPPFVPAIANALHNKEIILSGLTVGIVGYSIGNYIGIALAYLLR
jgi:Predicted integral membrane protein